MDHLIVIGCGHMGAALLQGWITHKTAARITVYDSKAAPLQLAYAAPFVTFKTPDEWVAEPADCVVLAVRPPAVMDAISQYQGAFEQGALCVSVAGGIRLERYGAALPPCHPVARVMPNLPASIGMGASGIAFNSHVSARQKEICFQLFNAVGESYELADDMAVDVFTLVAGSGPAYVFGLADVLGRVGAALGLPPELAMAAARQNVVGSAAYLAAYGDTSAADLCKSVQTKGGTTEAAFHVLNDKEQFYTLFYNALEKGVQRASELASA